MPMPDYEFIKKIKDGSIDVIEWLATQDEETIRKRIYSRIPEDLDVSVGSYEYDAIEPTNAEFAVAYFMLRNIILLAFPQYSFGEWLTLSAATHRVYRRDATYANGKLLITGVAGTVIQAGTKFSNTISLGSYQNVKYYTTQEDVTIGIDGNVEVSIIADEIGYIGNASSGEINLNIADVQGVTSISNINPISNGTNEESDESLLARLLDRVRNPISSGNKNAYKQWAKEISGIEDVEVIPLWNGPGTVQVIIIGSGGLPIPDLVDAVKEHLDPKENEGEGEGCAPIGAVVTVTTTESFAIYVNIINIEYENGYSLLNTQQNILNAVKNEVDKIGIGGLVRIHYIEDAIKHVAGITDFGNVLLNESNSNIQTPPHLKPYVKGVYIDGD